MNMDSIFAISCFLPLVLAVYWLIPGTRGKNWVLLIASVVFYSFGSLSGLALLLVSALFNYGIGLWLQGSRGRKAAVAVGVAVNLAYLGAYKYLDFLLGQVLGQPQLELGLIAPMGISFYTFKTIAYLVDTYRDPKQGTKNFPQLLLYISFFPQIVMGPITRFTDFQPQLRSRSHDLKTVAAGIRRFIVGLGKKLIIAGTLATVVDSVFALEAPALDLRLAWLGAIGYCLQLFFDFSGYIDMVVGMGAVFGFTTAENFNYPYIAPTVGNFWRRWHMSLSGWFKDYVYIPLGGNRKGKFRAGVNKTVVFFLCGLWHGAAWTYILWGLWHGLFSMLESLRIIPAQKLEKKGWGRPIGHIYTLLVVCLGFVMFRADSLSQGFAMIGAMFTGFAFTPAGTVSLFRILNWEAVAMLLTGVVLSMPVGPMLMKSKLGKYLEPVSYAAALALLVLCVAKLAAGDFAPSIYGGF